MVRGRAALRAHPSGAWGPLALESTSEQAHSEPGQVPVAPDPHLQEGFRQDRSGQLPPEARPSDPPRDWAVTSAGWKVPSQAGSTAPGGPSHCCLPHAGRGCHSRWGCWPGQEGYGQPSRSHCATGGPWP